MVIWKRKPPEPPEAMPQAAATPITILLAEDHIIVRQGLRALLETEPDFRLSPRRRPAGKQSN